MNISLFSFKRFLQLLNCIPVNFDIIIIRESLEILNSLVMDEVSELMDTSSRVSCNYNNNIEHLIDLDYNSNIKIYSSGT